MKIDLSSSSQQTKTELNEKFFTIADPAFVFDLLRNKIYSNPILAVCRELCCNALDAHREVGKGDVPIEIHLPTYAEPYFKVRDFGPGISPDRMEHIYLKYAASTKRDSNDQIGAFGIGAKSPFSYSDSFTIVTNFEGKCYNYMAFIDESRMGKLVTLSESDTTDSNGTEIIVPVKQGDWNNFQTSFEQVTRHWSVKPKINSGTGFNYRSFNKVIDNGNWFIANFRDSYYERKIKILVGEIEYNLDNVAARSFCDLGILSSLNSDLYLCFNVGDLSLAANRESIYLDASTKQAIADMMLTVKQDYIKLIKDKINAFPSFWEACSFVANDLGELCLDPAKLGLNNLDWNGIPVKFNIIDDNFDITEFYRKSHWKSEKEKIHHRKTGYIRFNNRSTLVVHDCGSVDANSKHIKPFFDENSTISSVFLLKPKNQTDESFDLDDFCKENQLDLYGFQLLSKHNKNIKARKTSDKAKMIVYKYNPSSNSFVTCNLSLVKSDPNKKVICHLRKDNWRSYKYPISASGAIPESAIKSASLIDPDVSIYGFDENVDPAKADSIFKDSTMLEDYINKYLSSNDQDFYFETIWSIDQYKSIQHRFDNYAFNEVVNDNSPVKQLIAAQRQIDSIIASRKSYIANLRSFNKDSLRQEDLAQFESWVTTNKKVDLNQYINQIKTTYPLISALDSWKFTESVKDIVHYINLIDKFNFS